MTSASPSCKLYQFQAIIDFGILTNSLPLIAGEKRRNKFVVERGIRTVLYIHSDKGQQSLGKAAIALDKWQ